MVPPEAVKILLCPLQIGETDAEAVTVIGALTVTVAIAVPVQLPVVPVTV